MEESDQLRFGFDLLDPTKFVPEELVPVTPIGKMTLNLNPKNYFAETEQIMVGPENPLSVSPVSLTWITVPTWPCRPWHRLL
jgi:catalase